jgi:hypothetical protein
LEEAMALSFEFVNNCKPGDLLRVKIEDTAELRYWAQTRDTACPRWWRSKTTTDP